MTGPDSGEKLRVGSSTNLKDTGDAVNDAKYRRLYKAAEDTRDAAYSRINKKYVRKVELTLPANGSKVDLEEALKNLKNHRFFNEKEMLYYTNLIYLIKNSKISKKFSEANGVKLDIKKSNANTLVYTIDVYPDKYKTNKFNALSNHDIEMLARMQELFMDLNDVAMPNTVKSGGFFPTFIQGKFSDVVKQFIGWHDLQEDDYKNTLSGETQYYLKATALNKPRPRGNVRVNFADIDTITNYDAYITRANKYANSKGYKQEIKTVADVVKYNQYLRDKQFNKLRDRVNYDPVNVMLNYIEQIKRVKINRDFEPELLLLQSVIGLNEFEARRNSVKGRNVINKVLSKLTGKTEVITEKGKETRVYDRYKEFFDAFEGKNRINGPVDQIINILHTMNSKSLMWLNVTAAIKNIGTGHINVVSEAVGGEFTNQKALLKAHERYIKAIPALLASLGDYETDNLDVALMKLSGNIFEDQRDAGFDNKVNIVSNALAAWDNIMYMPNSAGEHYLQFTMFLSTLDTHRIVKGEIMNYEQYTRSVRDKVFESILTEEQKESYKDYFETIQDFIAYPANNFTKAQKKEFANKYREAMKEGRKAFEQHSVVRDAFELQDGRAVLKENAEIDLETFAKFLGKVKGVNHSLHGIYNTFDKSSLSGMMLGEVVLQFRKWLRPNMIRNYGKKVGKVIFDERLEAYRSGAYTDWAKFIFANASYAWKNTLREAREAGEDVNFLTYSKALFKGFAGFVMFAKDMSFRYKTMPEREKANIRRTTFNFLTLVGLSALACILYNMKDDDDDLDDSIAFSMLTYAIYGVQTELFETTPHGIYSFYKRTTEAPIPFETTLGHWQDVLYWLLLGNLINDEEDLIYDRGTYKGQSKLSVALKRAVPLKNQYNKIINLPANDTYYMQQNWILQLIASMSKK